MHGDGLDVARASNNLDNAPQGMESRLTRQWSVLLLALLLVPTGQADWLQSGYDAAQTGNTPEDGPEWNDVVFQVSFDVARLDRVISRPLIIGGGAYVVYREPPAQANSSENATLGPNVLARIDLDDGTVREVGRPPGNWFIRGLASDGRLIFTLVDGGRVDAFPVEGGPRVWQAPVAPLGDADPGPAFRFDGAANCLRGGLLQVADGLVYVACDAHEASVYVMALEAESGRLVWDHLLDGREPMPTAAGGFPGASYLDTVQDASPPVGRSVAVTGLSRLGEATIVSYVSLVSEDATSTRGTVAFGQYVALGPTGEPVWAASTGLVEDAVERQGGNTGSTNVPPAATGDADRTFLELVMVEEWRAGNTGPYADRQVPIRAQGSHNEGDPGSGFALAPEGLYATSRRTMVLLDPQLVPQASLALAGKEWGPSPLARTGNGFVFASSGADGAGFGATHPNVEAMDAMTLRHRWTHSFATDIRFAVSNGLLVAWSEDGTLTVLGQSAASPRPKAVVSNELPAPGDLVRADLSGSGPGLFGKVTAYKADWGDGSVTDWQASPILEHRYASLSNFEARFSVRNAANQTASVTQAFIVGGTPELNFLQRQFAPDRQNTSFFILGLAATLLAALWGVINIRRSHGRLARELKALEERIEARKGPDLDEAIRAFRQRAQQLFAQRKIDHGQYLVLLGRVQEVQRGLRMSVVDERLAFLPHGMVKRLEAMLGDAQVTGWERHHFLEALDAERALNPQQRREVRALVDSWFMADQGKPAA